MRPFIRRPAVDAPRPGGLTASAVRPGILAVVLLVLVAAAVVYALGPPGSVAAALAGRLGLTSGSHSTGPLSGGGSNRVTLWAKMPIQAPECDCHTPPLARIYSQLKDEQLDAGFADEGTVGSWEYMSLSFDPRQISNQHVVDLITADGGVVLPARPTVLPTATATDHG